MKAKMKIRIKKTWQIKMRKINNKIISFLTIMNMNKIKTNRIKISKDSKTKNNLITNNKRNNKRSHNKNMMSLINKKIQTINKVQ